MYKQKQMQWAVTAALIWLFFGCQKDPIQPENARVYTITLKSKSSSPIRAASVSIQTAASNYMTTTGNDGIAQFTISNEESLPVFVIFTADHSSIMPEALTLPGAQDSNANQTIICEPAPSRVLVREAALHHLGDDYYGGSENSQLQIRTEGLEYSYSFVLNEIPSSMPYIRFYARGIQYGTQIKINGITVDRLADSDPQGDISRYRGQLTANPATVFRRGTNRLTIATVYDSSIDDWDDIEFCSLLLYYP